MTTISIKQYLKIKELIHKYDFKMGFTPLLDTLYNACVNLADYLSDLSSQTADFIFFFKIFIAIADLKEFEDLAINQCLCQGLFCCILRFPAGFFHSPSQSAPTILVY